MQWNGNRDETSMSLYETKRELSLYIGNAT